MVLKIQQLEGCRLSRNQHKHVALVEYNYSFQSFKYKLTDAEISQNFPPTGIVPLQLYS